VGDVKQSIYVWRNANPEILERLPALLGGVSSTALDCSWRSSPVIIQVINDVFDGLAGNPALEARESRGDADDDDVYSQAARLWHAGFNRHQVAPKNASLPGYVQVRFGPAREGSGRGFGPLQKKRRLRSAAELVAALHGANSRVRIALLTRTNDAVARLLYELGSDRLRVPASGRGGGPLIDAPPVNVLLDALHLADHPDDTVAAFNIARSPLGQALHFVQYPHDPTRRRFAREIRQSLLREGYQRTIARWVKAIAPACDARELRRAAQLVELAGTQDARAAETPALRPGDFIALVEQKDVPDAQSAPVEVMTIHQAKGLEFDAVVLAELDMALTGLDPSIVFERDEQSGEISRVSRWIGKEARDFVPELRPVVRQHRIRAIRESLSLLYVGMTRPRCALYLLIDPPSDSERLMPRNFGGVARGALAPHADTPDSIVFETGDSEWWRHIADHPSPADAPTEPMAIDRIALAADAADAVRGEATASPSMWAERSLARSRAGALRQQLRLRSPEARERGSVIHALFEQVGWLEDFAIDDAGLIEVARTVCPRRDHRWHSRCVQAFRAMLRQPALAGALSRGDSDPLAIRLYREHPFVRLQDRGLVQSGAIDRLVVWVDRDNRPQRALVLDFKTDALDDGALTASAQAQMHRPQLEMYRDAVSDMFALTHDQVGMQVMLVGAGVVVDL
jgi:ATP-dependent exoDNAse (exonuclease V) beta subunit